MNKKWIRNVAIVAALGALTVAFAATAYAATNAKTMADVAAAVTDRSVESVTDERADTNKTYGTIAKDAGKLDEFKAEALKVRKSQLDARVAAGTLTQDKADEIYAAIKKNQATCDGSGSARIGRSMGVCFGQGNGAGCGNGQGRGQGNGAGCGNGQGRGCGMGAGNSAGCGNGACAATQN